MFAAFIASDELPAIVAHWALSCWINFRDRLRPVPSYLHRLGIDTQPIHTAGGMYKYTLNIPVDSGGHEYKIWAHQCLHIWQRYSCCLINNHKLRLAQLVSICGMYILQKYISKYKTQTKWTKQIQSRITMCVPEWSACVPYICWPALWPYWTPG